MSSPTTTFTEKLATVQKSIAAIQRGDMDVAEVMRVFEQGSTLLSECEAQLTEAEGRYRELTGEDAGGRVRWWFQIPKLSTRRAVMGVRSCTGGLPEAAGTEVYWASALAASTFFRQSHV